MKRSGFPEASRSALASDDASKRSPMRRAPSRGRRAREAEWSKVCRERRETCGGTCEFPLCNAPGAHGHHRLPRSQGGKDTLENCLWLCAHHHDYVHLHPAESYERGWMLRRSG